MLPHGSTGRVAFDDNGDRIYAEYDIINVQYAGPNNKTQVSVGQYFYPAVSKSVLNSFVFLQISGRRDFEFISSPSPARVRFIVINNSTS